VQTVNIHEAKTHLSLLVDQAANGEPFVIAKAGKTVGQSDRAECAGSREGSAIGIFAEGQITVPDDFNQIGNEEIGQLFGTGSVKLLLDTHLLLWSAGQARFSLSAEARGLIGAAGE